MNKFKNHISAGLSVLILSTVCLYQPAVARESLRANASASLSASASQQVQQDTLQVILVAESSANQQAQAANEVNQRLTAAMQKAKATDAVQAASGNYRVWPSTDKDGKVSEWRARAEIILKSRDFDATAALVAELSGLMAINGLNFSVSRELQAQTEQALLADASKAFAARALALSQALGFDNYRIKNIELSDSGRLPTPIYGSPRMLAVSADSTATAPSLEAGLQEIEVRLSGTVYLLPK